MTRRRFRATPTAAPSAGFNIGIQLRAGAAAVVSTGEAPAAAAPAGDLEIEVSLMPPAQGYHCSWLICIRWLRADLFWTEYAAVWDDIGTESDPGGEFQMGSVCLTFSSLAPMTNLYFYITLNDGTILESGPHACAV